MYWLSVGAQPSDAVRVLLNKQGTFERLSRYHAGESLDALVTEYTGVAPKVAAPVVEAVAVQGTEPSIAEQAVDAVGDAAAAVAAPVVAVAEKVEDAVDDLVEAVDAALDADEEE